MILTGSLLMEKSVFCPFVKRLCSEGKLNEDRLGRKADLCSFWSDLNDDCLIRSGLMSLLENGVQYGQEEENWN